MCFEKNDAKEAVDPEGILHCAKFDSTNKDNLNSML